MWSPVQISVQIWGVLAILFSTTFCRLAMPFCGSPCETVLYELKYSFLFEQYFVIQPVEKLETTICTGAVKEILFRM